MSAPSWHFFNHLRAPGHSPYTTAPNGLGKGHEAPSKVDTILWRNGGISWPPLLNFLSLIDVGQRHSLRHNGVNSSANFGQDMAILELGSTFGIFYSMDFTPTLGGNMAESSPLCPICKTSDEDIDHLFFTCPQV